MLLRSPLRTLLRNLPCTCTPSAPRSYATAAPPADKLVLAARKFLEPGPNAHDGGIEAAKRARELEDLTRALADVEEGTELVATLQHLSTTDPDEEFRELAASDLPLATTTLASLRSALLSTLLPPSSSSSLSAILEVKSGVGGSESALFAAELVRMYTRLAVRKGWKAVLVESVGLGGVGMGTGDAYREEEEEVEKVEKEAKVDKGKRVEVAGGAAGGGGDEGDSEAAALLLLMFGGPDSKDDDKPDKPFKMTAATTYGSSPDTTPPSPPKPGSSAASAGSTEAPDIIDSQRNKKRSRASDPPQVGPRPSSAPRSTRRTPLLERASPSPPPARVAAGRRVPTPLSRTSNTPKPSNSPKAAEASTSALDKKPTTGVLDKKAVRLPQLERARSTSASASPRPHGESSEARGTRRSAPLQGGLRDLLASPAVTAVAGGYDPISKRYVNKRVKSRSPSPEPEPVEQPEVRGTRRSRPIDGDLRNLLASSLVTSVAGGYDPVSKRYVGKRTKSRSRSIEVEQEPEAGPSTVRGTRRSRPLEGDIRSLLASPSVAAVAGGFDARSGKYFSRKGDGDGQRKPKKSLGEGSAGSGSEASPVPAAARARVPTSVPAPTPAPARAPPPPAPVPALAAAASLARAPPPSPPRSNIRWGKPSMASKSAMAAGGAFAKKMEGKEEGH